jgi:hypothetical protein
MGPDEKVTGSADGGFDGLGKTIAVPVGGLGKDGFKIVDRG